MAATPNKRTELETINVSLQVVTTFMHAAILAHPDKTALAKAFASQVEVGKTGLLNSPQSEAALKYWDERVSQVARMIEIAKQVPR